MASAGGDTISLRPMSLRPGGGKNPFAGFAKGAGVGLKLNTLQATSAPEKRKPRGEVTKYSRDFLMSFAAKCVDAPADLRRSGLDIVLDPSDPGRLAQQALLQRVAADTADDERDWRAHGAFTPTPVPAPGAPTPAGGAVPAAPAAGAEDGGGANKIQRAEDIGRTAWAAGSGDTEGVAATMRRVKGILNKLTPEKFERLLAQFIPLVTSHEVLAATITEVFESAVAQPTFVAMYAQLCRELDAVLPEFVDPGTGGGPATFRKMLANTCQEEYEATDSARRAAPRADDAEAEGGARVVKLRLLGTIRLISELFKQGLVNDRIMLLILADLLGADGAEPGPDAVEAVCELLTTAGGTLETGSPRARARLDAAFAVLARLASSKAYPSRIRFLARDVIDLRAGRWVPRREAFTAKKLEDVHAEAAAELGLDVALPGLDPAAGTLGALTALAPLAPRRTEQLDLFPAFRSDDAGWAASRAAMPVAGDGPYSAFLGEYVAVQSAASGDVSTAAGADVVAARTPLDVTPERRESLAQSIFTDWLAEQNFKEALAATQDLAVPGFMRRLVEIGLLRAYDARTEAEGRSVVDLLLQLAARGQIPGEDLQAALGTLGPRLEDDAMDFRFAPAVLGRLAGAGAAQGAMPLTALAAAVAEVEGAEPRRGAVLAALIALRDASSDGMPAVLAAVAEAKLDLNKLLAFDAEFDGELPPPAQALADAGLPGLVA